MKHVLRPLLCVSWLVLLAGCESNSSNRQVPVAASPRPPAARAEAAQADARAADSVKRPVAVVTTVVTGYRRYRGTVGGLPVTMELTPRLVYASTGPTPLGRYYYDRHGAALDLSSKDPFRPGEPLYLAELDSGATGHWQATQPLGPVLSGTWFGAKGQQLPFRLQEEYAGAVRYEVLTETVTAGECEDQDPVRPRQVSRDFLHLLGSDTLRPGLRRLQCPPPARRRTQLLAELAETSCDGQAPYGHYTDIQVRLNGDGLLSLLTSELDDLGGAYPSGSSQVATYDLATGQPCAVGQWLRPEQDQLLRQLLSRQLVRLEYPQNLTAPEEPEYVAAMPEFGLNSEGLYCTLGDFGAPQVAQRAEATIPYAALYPCVRPGTPLMRLIEARGLRPTP